MKNIVGTVTIGKTTYNVCAINKAAKTITVVSNSKVESFTELGSSTYHIYRNWLRDLLKTNDVKAKFVRTEGYYGIVKVETKNVIKATRLIKKFVKENKCAELVAFD